MQSIPRAAAGAAALAAALCLIPACTKVGTQPTVGGGSATGHPWTKHGHFVFGENGDPRSLNPMLNSSAVTGDLSMFIYSYAVRYDEHAKPVPDALREIPTVENGDVSRDGLTLKYKLRGGIKWHDGQPLTSHDLKFTWQAVMNPHNNVNTTDGYKDVASIDDRDPLVAVVHMKRLYAPFLQQLWGVNGNAPILPAHILARYNDEKGSLNSAPYNAHPVGSGPFQVVAWERGTQVRMKAFPDYFLGKPRLDEVVFKIFPDSNTLLTQLRTHEVDMIARGTAANWAQYTAIPGTIAIKPETYVFSHLDFNLRRPLFQDLTLRKALAYGVNRQEIIGKVLHGLAVPCDTDQSPHLSPVHTDDIEHHPYDPVKARALLDADGWRVGPDGIRVKNGRRLAFNLQTPTESVTGREIETLVQRSWHDVGVDAQIKNAPTNIFFDNTASGILQGGKYDVALFSWSASVDPDDAAIYAGDNFAPHGQNALFWNDPIATKAMHDALQTIDFARRKKDYVIVQQRLASQIPTIILYFQEEPFVYNSDLKGFRPSPVISAFWDPWRYSI